MALIREHRNFRGLTQDALAKLVGASRSLIAEWETGVKVPNETRLQAVAKALGTTVPGLYKKPGAAADGVAAVDLDGLIADGLSQLSEKQKEEALAYIAFLASRPPRPEE